MLDKINPLRTISPVLSHIWVLLAYFSLTILMTWPTVLHLSDGIPGDGFDGWQNYWNLWWVKEALLIQGTNPYFTDYLYPPNGSNLLFHTLNIFNGLWTLPIQLNFGLAIAYNSVVFFSFVLAGYSAYLLSLYTLNQFKLPNFGGIRAAAFVGGLIFTMSPFHLAHLLGHMQVFSMVWPPLYVLWLIRTLQPWAALPPQRYAGRDIALTCLFLILATSVDWYHTLYLFLFTGLVLLWCLSRQWQHYRAYSKVGQSLSLLLRPLWPVLALSLGFGLILSPLLIPMVREAGNRPDLQTGLAQNITLSADLLAFFLPSEMHPLWGAWASRIANNFTTTTSERLIFAGFVPLTLVLFITLRGWSSSIVRFWTFILLFFFLLALGPFLHIGGQTVSIAGWPVPLPYLLLYYTIPFIGLTRSLSRYDLMVMLALGVLAALALVKLQLLISTRSVQSPKLRPTHSCPERSRRDALRSTWLPLLATFLICFEFLPLPYPISKIETPPFYFDLAADPETYTIAELPMNWDRPTPLLQQTVHQKRLLTAYTSRDNPLELAWRIPVLQHWRHLEADIIDQPLAEIAPTIFFDFNLRYIVLDYWQMPPGPEREGTEKWVAAALPTVMPIYDDGRLKVYQTPPHRETHPYLSLGEGWSDRQQNETDLTRAFAGVEAQVFLHHPQNQALTLEITAASSQETQAVTLLADDTPLTTFAVTPTFSRQSITLPSLTDELVKLKFVPSNEIATITVKRLALYSKIQPQ